MRLRTLPFGTSAIVQPNSDIDSLTFDGQALVVVLGVGLKSPTVARGLQVRFSSVVGFRYLYEADLARYWVSQDFVRGHHILEVVEGGWSTEESMLQGYPTVRREWLIVTGNGCVNLFSSSEPEVSEAEIKLDA